MPGSNAGTGQPIILKCSKCKLSRDHYERARSGDLYRTGREKRMKHGGIRSGLVKYECWCADCGHVGWYQHKQAALKPLRATRYAA